MQWMMGIDTHKESFEIGVVDHKVSEVDFGSFTNDRSGLQEATAWIQSHEGERIIGVECSGSYGAPIARALVAAGELVKEVPPLLAHRERRKEPSKGKSDRVDAFAIARVVARGEGLSTPRLGGIYDDLKLLVDERKSLVRTKTQLANQTHSDLVVAYPGYQDKIPRIARKANVGEVRGLLRGDRSIRASLIRDRLAEIDRLILRIAKIDKLIEHKVIESGTTLHEQPGISFVLAATILGESGGSARLRSEAAFAMLNGTAPVPASSGKTQHHRLNRRGNRRLNWAVHTVAVVRLRMDDRSKAYVSKKRAEGKSNKDAMRCLKRHISNDLYRRMVSDELARQNGG